jgi:hypothetical protein
LVESPDPHVAVRGSEGWFEVEDELVAASRAAGEALAAVLRGLN